MILVKMMESLFFHKKEFVRCTDSFFMEQNKESSLLTACKRMCQPCKKNIYKLCTNELMIRGCYYVHVTKDKRTYRRIC